MLKTISELMDLPENQGDLVITEFNAKFARTFMKINGFCEEIIQFDGKTLKTKKKLYKEKVVIKPHNPKTGLYGNENTLIYLYRIPDRQWLKSFSLFNNYGYRLLAGTEPNSTEELLNLPYLKNTTIFNSTLYIFWKAVGSIKTDPYGYSFIVLNDSGLYFNKEIHELCPQYRIISAIDFQKRCMEEKQQPVKQSVLKSKLKKPILEEPQPDGLFFEMVH